MREEALKEELREDADAAAKAYGEASDSVVKGKKISKIWLKISSEPVILLNMEKYYISIERKPAK